MFLAILTFLVLPSTPCDPKIVDIADVAGDFRGNEDNDFHAKVITDIT